MTPPLCCILQVVQDAVIIKEYSYINLLFLPFSTFSGLRNWLRMTEVLDVVEKSRLGWKA